MEQVLHLRDLKLIERVHARGGRFSYFPLLGGEPATAGNFFLQLSRTYSDFESPRHRHNFDQIRLQIEADADFARDGVMKPGMVGYFPEGVFYGPQSIAGDSLTLVLQFGGASRSGYLSEEQFQRGIAELREVGTFEAGVFKTAKPEGGTRSQDAYEAVWEHLNGRKMVYPDARYEGPVLLRPSAANWVEASDKGIARKHLGTFSEAKTAISATRVDAGAQLPVPANVLVFVMSGRGSVPGAGDWERHSSMYSGKSRSTLTASESSELLEITLPTL